MELLGSGRRWVIANSFASDRLRREVSRRLTTYFRTLIQMLFYSALLWIGTSQAQTTYTRDANGRVVAVTQGNGTTAQYTYDALGRTTQVGASISPGQLALFAFTPTHGVAGAAITIYGQGFSTSASSDTVTFNGISTAVLSASSTQLSVAVPNGATTGPISVTADGQTATSAVPFVVDDTGVPPSIIQVSPGIVTVGSTVTITGTHLDPLPGQTTVQVGGRDVALLSATDTQLRFVSSDTSSSGYVTVQTPYGQATSTTLLLVLPSGFNTASVVSSDYATVNGSSVSLSIGAANEVGAVVFNASVGSWLSLQASTISPTTSTINYSIYAPGNGVIAQGTVSASAPSIHLPQLMAGGSYVALFQPSSAGAQLAIGVQANTLLVVGTPTTLVTTVPGQSQRVLFQAGAGQSLAFAMLGTNTSPANHTVSYTVYAPGGLSYTSTTTSSTGIINLGNLPMDGTYQIVIAPGSGVTGTMQMELATSTGGTLPSSGTWSSYTAAVNDENAYLSFAATAGQNLELTLSNINVPGATTNGVEVYVYNPSGTFVASDICYASNPASGCRISIWNTLAGMYSVVVVPTWGGTASFKAQVQADVVGPALSSNTPTTVNLAAGQVERLTFTANAGGAVALQLSGVTTTPSGQTVAVLVFQPGAITTSDGYTSFSTTTSGTINLANLPASGTYTAMVYTGYGEPGSAQLTVASSVAPTLSSNGTPQSDATQMAGQNAYLSFTANTGDNLELTFNNLTGAGFNVAVYNAAGSEVTSFSCSPSSPGASCRGSLWNLTAGTYSVGAAPTSNATLSFSALLQPDIVGPTLTAGTPTTVTLTSGQVERLTFTANAGATVALQLSGATTVPPGQSVSVLVFKPGAITTSDSYTNFSATTSSTINLANLPTSGTYTAMVYTGYGEPGSAQLTLTTP